MGVTNHLQAGMVNHAGSTESTESTAHVFISRSRLCRKHEQSMSFGPLHFVKEAGGQKPRLLGCPLEVRING